MSQKKLKIVKIGGNIINHTPLLSAFLKDFSAIKGPKVLVHGGGKKATELASNLGLEPKMIGGRRVTDEANLEVVTMVYAGLLNKNIVAELQQYNCNAFGITGADGNSIQAHKRIVKDIDYGYAGDIDRVNSATIESLLHGGLMPVFCAITHDKNGQLLNTNADTIASEVAIAMSTKYEVELNYVFELKGVLSDFNDKNSVIPAINKEYYAELVAGKVISDGMLPKMLNCFNALEKGVTTVKIGDAAMIKNEKTVCTTLKLV